jgi:hypothetical protein
MGPIDFMKVTLASWGTRASTLVAQLRGAGEEGDDDAAEAFDGVEVAQPMGLRANPVQRATLEGVVVEIGDERYVLCLVDKSVQTGAVNPERGGTVLYGCAAPDAVVYVRASGAIEITAKAGTDVVLNGGSLNVARSSDAVQVTLDVTAVRGITAPPGGGPCTLTTGAVTLSGSITGAGAPHVKA